MVAVFSICHRLLAAAAGACAIAGMASAQELPSAPALCATQDTAGVLAYFLDVGQGDAMILLGPAGRVVVVDGGESATSVRDVVRRLGVARVDLLVISHYHADHIGGLPEILESIPVGSVLENGVATTTMVFQRTVSAIQASGAQVLRAEARTITVGDLTVRVFPSLPQASSQNLASVGLTVSLGEFRLLLTGDAETQTLDWWVDQRVIPQVSVAKVGHHGSHNGTTPRLVEAARPSAVVVSVGATNGYGHPDPQAIRQWASRARHILRTDVDGTVVVRGCRDGSFRIRTAQGSIVSGGQR